MPRESIQYGDHMGWTAPQTKQERDLEAGYLVNCNTCDEAVSEDEVSPIYEFDGQEPILEHKGGSVITICECCADGEIRRGESVRIEDETGDWSTDKHGRWILFHIIIFRFSLFFFTLTLDPNPSDVR